MIREVAIGVVVCVFSVFATLALANSDNVPRAEIERMINEKVDAKFTQLQSSLVEVKTELTATRELLQKVQIDLARQSK